jgi:hypothetical protein
MELFVLTMYKELEDGTTSSTNLGVFRDCDDGLYSLHQHKTAFQHEGSNIFFKLLQAED